MKTISMLDLRTGGRALTKRLERGETLGLTYRGKQIATLVPVEGVLDRPMPARNAVRGMVDLAEWGLGTMSSAEIDHLLYGGR